jgi:hypothetical protein
VINIARTLLVILTVSALILFAFFNWYPVEVQIWDNLILETKLPVVVIMSFLLGFLPTWLLYRSLKWRYGRRIRALETATVYRAHPAGTAARPASPSPETPVTGGKSDFPAPAEAARARPLEG